MKNCAMNDTFDKLDRKILQQLQINCRQSTEHLGAIVGLSATACQRRIKKLRDSGVIHSEVAILDAATLQSRLTVLVEIKFNKGGTVVIEGFKALMRDCPAVQQCYYLAGDVDFSVIISVANIQEYELLTRSLFLNNPNIVKFSSRVSMDNVKTSLAIPLD
ncbi:ArsR family transcriptional regulator ['Osedax' symbiont bacterium Rs2_46_30_T18]|nr:ArsR family transcriptional regulator ['Osedax' symbiont bacterium Rs2_46_30_T18]